MKFKVWIAQRPFMQLLVAVLAIFIVSTGIVYFLGDTYNIVYLIIMGAILIGWYYFISKWQDDYLNEAQVKKALHQTGTIQLWIGIYLFIDCFANLFIYFFGLESSLTSLGSALFALLVGTWSIYSYQSQRKDEKED